MTLEDIKTILEATGLPVAYRAFPEGGAPALPFLCYYSPYTNNFAADGVAYAIINHISVELYTQVKDPATEGKVEAALTGAGIYWDKSETYLEDEKCFQILYEIEV